MWEVSTLMPNKDTNKSTEKQRWDKMKGVVWRKNILRHKRGKSNEIKKIR